MCTIHFSALHIILSFPQYLYCLKHPCVSCAGAGVCFSWCSIERRPPQNERPARPGLSCGCSGWSKYSSSVFSSLYVNCTYIIRRICRRLQVSMWSMQQEPACGRQTREGIYCNNTIQLKCGSKRVYFLRNVMFHDHLHCMSVQVYNTCIHLSSVYSCLGAHTAPSRCIVILCPTLPTYTACYPVLMCDHCIVSV